MSKVKIQGNASGTGVLTVTAPNTSTDRVITLPDATGTLLNSDGDGSSLTGVADATKLPLAGGTMTGNLVVGGGAAPRISITSNNANGSSAVNFLSTTNNSKNWEVGSNLHNSDGLEFTPSTANGNSTFTTPTVSFPVAGGITFGSDTAAANALDDYEEGVHQLSITGSTSGSMTLKSGYEYLAYTKIGRLVTVQGRWETTAKNSASGTMTFSLPFTAGSFNGQSGVSSGVFSLYRAGANFNNVRINVFSGANTATIWYNQGGTGDSDDRVEMQNIDGTVEGYMCLTYMTA